MRWSLLALLLAGVACSGSDPDDRHIAADRDAGPCMCVAVSLPSGNLCDCPEIVYGCEGQTQTFRLCDVAPPCWTIGTDPATGCRKPEIDYTAAQSCSCLIRDAGT